jgi:diguanylate cyclase (GGDEF)-like protein
LQRALARLARYGEGFAVLYLDVDEFKAVNDSFGHASGDELLAQIAGRLLAAVRAIDVVARMSGDEFAILAANVSDPKQAFAVAQRVMRAVEVPFVIGRHEVSNAISIGIAVAPGRRRCGNASQERRSGAVSREERGSRIGAILALR